MVGEMLTVEQLRERFRYDLDDGHFWRRWPGLGHVVGTINRRGYCVIRIGRRDYYAHRLAWLYITGEWPPQQIDHRNNIRSDNRWANLRLATPAENARNSHRRRDNATGGKGITFESGKWRARIRSGGKQLHLGRFETIGAATAAYGAAAKMLHGDFARAV